LNGADGSGSLTASRGRRELRIMKSTPRAPTRIRSVAKAVSILVWLAGQPEARSAKQIATALGLPIATAYHILDTLAQDGMLFKDERRLYHLGPSVGLLVDAFQRQNSPPEYLLAPLRRLAEATGETTYLSVSEGSDVVVLAAVEGSHAVRVRGLHVGFRGSLHARGSGKLLLAYADQERIDRYLATVPLVPRTTRTIVDPDALRAELAAIRERGYSFDEEEFTDGVSGVSAPVLRGGIPVAAYTISTPSERFGKRRSELLSAVLAAAAAGTTSQETHA
jgi:IclR family acetate operon transcriptional repressor